MVKPREYRLVRLASDGHNCRCAVSRTTPLQPNRYRSILQHWYTEPTCLHHARNLEVLCPWRGKPSWSQTFQSMLREALTGILVSQNRHDLMAAGLELYTRRLKDNSHVDGLAMHCHKPEFRVSARGKSTFSPWRQLLLLLIPIFLLLRELLLLVHQGKRQSANLRLLLWALLADSPKPTISKSTGNCYTKVETWRNRCLR
jgi:hypothetical protein